MNYGIFREKLLNDQLGSQNALWPTDLDGHKLYLISNGQDAPVLSQRNGIHARTFLPALPLPPRYSANVAIIFTLALLPLISGVGCAVDLSRANALRSKLQAAADAASVGSVSKTAPGFIAAGSMTGDGAIPAGVADAANLFIGT